MTNEIGAVAHPFTFFCGGWGRSVENEKASLSVAT